MFGRHVFGLGEIERVPVRAFSAEREDYCIGCVVTEIPRSLTVQVGISGALFGNNQLSVRGLFF